MVQRLRKLLCCLAAIIMLNANVAAEELLFLDLTVNYRHYGTTLLLKDDQDSYYASISDLSKWGVRGPYVDIIEHDERQFARLRALGNIVVEYDARTVSATISIPAELLPTQQLAVSRRSTPDTVSSTGAYLDYDWSYISVDGATDDSDASYATGLLAPTFFSDAGALHTQVLYQGYEPPPDSFAALLDRSDTWIRLDTTFTRDFPDKMRSLRIGDVINRPGPWGNGQRVGGLQFASNFATRPSFISFPIPSVQGSTSLPSTLDLYVDGARRHRQNIEAGPFRVDQIPVVTGSGQMQMVVTDVLGREQIYTQDFYASAELLRPGLSEYAYSLGALRSDFGYSSSHYGKTVALGEHRYGVSNELTVGGRAELSGSSTLAFASADWSPSTVGIVSAGLGLSDSDAGSGSTWLLGYRFQTREYNVSAQIVGTSAAFRSVGMEEFGRIPKRQIILNGGWNHAQIGSLGAAFVRMDYHDLESRDIVTLNYSKRLFERYYFSVFANYYRDSHSDRSIGVTLSTNFGSRRSVTANMRRSGNESMMRMEAQSALPTGPGIGYRVGRSIGDQQSFDSRFTGQTSYGRYTADADRYGNATSLRAGASGSVAWLAGRPYFAREINDGFAVARVGTLENVRVYVENQEIGRSDSEGRILLPRLRPYETNRVRIEPLDLPLASEVPTISMEVAPAFRSGIVIDFPVTTPSFALLRAILPSGEPVPGGATVYLSGKDEPTIVGLDGSIYATGPEGPTEIRVEWATQGCQFEILLPPSSDALPHLGDFDCSPVPQ